MHAGAIVELALVGLWGGSAAYIHLRGKVRHKFWRQVSDYSTVLAPLNAFITAFSAVPRTPMQNVDDFPEVRPITEKWEMIRDEAMRLFDEGHIRPAEKHNDVAFNTFFRRGWKRFYIKWYDEPLPSAQALCPKTVELVQSIPEVNAALFALLPPQSKLGEHRDPFAGSLRYHLGLITPNSDLCRIYVDGNEYSWRDGEAVMFDETFIHSVDNETDQFRIIFFCDIVRPVRTPVVRAFNRFMTKHVVKITAAQNEEIERLGAVNGISRYIYLLREWGQRKKKNHRRIYYTIKYAVMAALAYVIVIRPLL